MRRIFLVALVFATAIRFALPRAGYSSSPIAGTAILMDIEELVAEADLVLEGRVLGMRCIEDERGRIVTDYELAVHRTFAGAPLARRTLRLPGGLLPDGRGLLIPGAPDLGLGEEALLVLSQPSDGGMRVVTGLSQGKFRLVRGPGGERFAVRSGAASLARAATGELHESTGVESFAYADLVARIEAAVNSSRGPGSGGRR